MFYRYQIEMRDRREKPIGGGRWFPILSHDSCSNFSPADWAEELARMVRHESRNVEYRLVYVKRCK